jgi:hypothetical protein
VEGRSHRIDDDVGSLVEKQSGFFVIRAITSPYFHRGADYTFCDHIGLLNLSRTLLVVSETITIPLRSGSEVRSADYPILIVFTIGMRHYRSSPSLLSGEGGR